MATKVIHRIKKHEHTHNGVKQTWWTCTAGDWDQDGIEHGTQYISPRVARERFNAHLPKERP